MSNDSSTGGYLQPTSAAPAEDDALDNILQQLVVGITGLPGSLVRPRWQPVMPKMPEPSVDWCAIGVTQEDPLDHGAQWHIGRDTSGTNPNGYSVSLDWVVITVLASFYGPNARGNATLLRSGLLIAQNREALTGTGISLLERPGVLRFVPQIENEQTWRRVDIEMRFNRAIQRTWAIDDLLDAHGDLLTDRPDSQTFETPSSTNPLEP